MARTQAECLHRLRRLIPPLAASSPAAAHLLIERIVRTCIFLGHMEGLPSPLDQEKILSLSSIFRGIHGDRIELAKLLEGVLFHVKQNASKFFELADDRSFVESLLESLLGVPAMRRIVADTVIGIFKQMGQFGSRARALALQKMVRFMCRHQLSKDFTMHPTAEAVQEVLVRHVRIDGYSDYGKYSDTFKSNLVTHALLGLRAVLTTHLRHSSDRGIHTREFLALVQQCASVGCTLLQGGRVWDRAVAVECEAVRLLLTCARVDSSLQALAYHAGVFLLRRELQGFQSEEPRQSDEPPARPRAHTDAAVRGLAGSRTSGMTVALRGAMSPDGSAQGQSESEGSKHDLHPISLQFEVADETYAGPGAAAVSLSLSVPRLSAICSLLHALDLAAVHHMDMCVTDNGAEAELGKAQIEAVFAAMSECLLHFVVSNDAVLRCVVLQTACPIDHIMGVWNKAAPHSLDESFTAVDFETVTQAENSAQISADGSRSREESRPHSSNDLASVTVGARSSTLEVTAAYRDRYEPKSRPLSQHEQVYSTIVGMSRLVTARYCAYFSSPIAKSTFQSVTSDIYSVLRSLEPHAGTQLPDPHIVQRTETMLAYMEQLLRDCELVRTAVGAKEHSDMSASNELSASGAFPVLVQMYSSSTHYGVLKHVVSFINTCVHVFEISNEDHPKRRAKENFNYFDVTLDLYCGSYSRSFQIVLTALSTSDVIEMLRLRNSRAKRLEFEHSLQLQRANAVVRSSCDGIEGLIVLLTGQLIGGDLSALLRGYRRMVAVQRALIVLFVDMAGQLLRKGLTCYASSPGGGAHMLSLYLEEAIDPSIKESYIKFLQWLFVPLAKAFEGVTTAAMAVQTRLFQQYPSKETVAGDTVRSLQSVLDEILAADLCETTLLRAFWTYIGILGFVGNYKMDPLRVIARHCGSLVASSIACFKPIFDRFVEPAASSSDSAHKKRWCDLLHGRTGSRGKNLSLELDVCPVTEVVRECSKLKNAAHDYDHHLFKKLESAVIELLDTNLIAVSAWDKNGNFSVPSDLGPGGENQACMPPIGELGKVTSSAVRAINQSNVQQLCLSARLCVYGISVLEGIRVQLCSDKVGENIGKALLSYIFDIQMHSHHKATSEELNLWKCIHGVAFTRWQQWCLRLGRMLVGSEGLSSVAVLRDNRQEVVSNMIYLLSELSDPCGNKQLRHYALTFVYTLINNCPWGLWNPDILGHIFSRCSYLEEIRSDATERVNSVDQSNGLSVDAPDTALVSNSVLSAVSVTFISLAYHWCSTGVHYYSSLMTSAMLDYQLLTTHPFLQENSSGFPRAEVDALNAPLGLEIAAEMCASEGVPTFQATAAYGDNILGVPSPDNGVSYSKLSRNNMESYPLAIERRSAAADIAGSFRQFVLSAEKEGLKNDMFPVRWSIRNDIGNLRYVDLSARSYVFGSLVDSDQLRCEWSDGSVDSRLKAYEKIKASFSFASKGLVTCWEGKGLDESAGLGLLNEYIRELHRCILLSAGFTHLSIKSGIFDGHTLSCVSLMAECLILNFTEETGKVATGAYLWLLSAHAPELTALVLTELSRVLRFSAETYLGIFARRESGHSNIRRSNESFDIDTEVPCNQSTLVAVPTLFSAHPVVPDTKDRYLPSVGDQLAAHVVVIDFVDYVFEILLVRRDHNGILFACMEVILMNSAIYPSMYLLGSISTSNASKTSASYFPVGIGAPMFRLLGFGLRLLRHYNSVCEALEKEYDGKTVGGAYNTASMSLLLYCEKNNISTTVPAFAVQLAQSTHSLNNMYAVTHLRNSLTMVSLMRRRILRERIYSFIFTAFNSPNNSLNNSPRPNAQTRKGSQQTPNRSIDTEIRVLLELGDLLEADANFCWKRDYGTSDRNSDPYGTQSRLAGPYEVIRWVDRALFLSDQVGPSVADGGDEVRSVLFNPHSIFAHQKMSATGGQYTLHPPEADLEAHLSVASVMMQRFCGINASVSAESVTSSVSEVSFRSIAGVLHLAKMCIGVQLDRMFAWRSVMYEEMRRHKLRREKCPVMSDYQFSTIEYNISRRAKALRHFRDSCCTKLGIHVAVLAAWAFHPSLALRIDQAFQYRSLTDEHSSKAVATIQDQRVCEIAHILVADTTQRSSILTPKTGITGLLKSKEHDVKKILTKKIRNQLYELCFPRISDLIAHNPVALRADYSSAGYVLGIVGDVTFRTAHRLAAKHVPRKAGERAMSQLRMWAIYGDKNVHTIFSKLSRREEMKDTIDINWKTEYKLDYHRNTLMREQQQRAIKNSISHRAAHCPMYLLSHWAMAPPDYAISLLQRPILTHLGRSVVSHSAGGAEEDDERQLERWQEKLHSQSFVVQYVIRSLSSLDPETLLFYLPQLVQLLRRDKLGAIRSFLEEQAKTSNLLCHQLIWLLETESISEADMAASEDARLKPSQSSNEQLTADQLPPSTNINKDQIPTVRSELHASNQHRYGYCNQLAGMDTLPTLSQRLHRLVVASLSSRARAYMQLECEYFNSVTNISAKLALVRNKDLHNHMIKEELCKMGLHKGLYLPTDPHKLLVGVNVNSGTPMQSAAKCPFLLVFHTVEWGGPDSIEHNRINESETGDGNDIGCDDIQPPILSNKVGPGLLQPVRIRHSSVSGPDGVVQDIDWNDDVADAPRGTGREMMLFEDGFPPDEDDAAEEGSDDPSKEFANIRKCRAKSHSAKYHTSLVNDYDITSNTEPSMEMVSTTEKNNRWPKRFSPAAVKKEFYRSLNVLSCDGKSLCKGTEKWSSHWRGQFEYSSPVKKVSVGYENPTNTACIFKVYDDCRQDALTIQFIRILYDTFTLEHRMPLYLYPYRVVPNRTGKNKAMGGIIQVIPDVRSRDDIGKSGAKTLLQHFRAIYGPEDSIGFKRAQRAFACSQAAYAVVCYLLQIKDRHNGNLVIDKEGHVVHIDFGFLLGISPGKNLGFETAAFKFSTEMFQLLGGSLESEPYIYFVDMTVKAFLIARELKHSLLTIITSFADSGLPCFTHKADNIEKLLGRFMPDLSDADAGIEMKRLVNDACRKWTTIMYDGIQKLQNNIYSDAWM